MAYKKKLKKKHVCDTCNRAFSFSYSLNEHKHIHSGRKPYQCMICLRCFTHKSSLACHKDTHSLVKKNQCSFCPFQTVHLTSLKRHIKSLHNGRMSSLRVGQESSDGRQTHPTQMRNVPEMMTYIPTHIPTHMPTQITNTINHPVNTQIYITCTQNHPPPRKRMVNGHLKKVVAAEQLWKCFLCHQLLSACFEVDHWIPLKKGGSNHRDNLVALCRECHGMKTIHECL